MIGVFPVGQGFGLGFLPPSTPSSETTIESAIYEILKADSPVVTLVSSRIYPIYLAQNCTMPAITYQQVSGDREYTVEGAIGMVQGRFQVNCWDDDYAGARALSEAVRIALEDWSGTKNSRKIHTIFLDDEGDIPQITPGNEVLRRQGKRLDFIVWFNEALT